MPHGPQVTQHTSTPNGVPIMASKFLVPTLRLRTVIRERLLDTISQGADGPLTLLKAPAGSGKTALLSSWVVADRPPGHVVWLSLDPEDAQPGVFWSYVLAGLARDGLVVSGAATPTRSDAVEQALLIRLAASLFERSDPLVVVLDNAESLTGSVVPEQIDYVLGHAGPQLRVVVASRADLAFPVHRYRLASTVVEIGFGDLAFVGEEAGDLLAAHGINLPGDVAEARAEAARGWAAGLVLTAAAAGGMGVWGGTAGTGRVPGLALDDLRAVSEYFVTEVLNTQPSGVQDVLLRTSVVGQLCPELAVVLTGRRDAARVLAELARDTMLLVTGGGEHLRFEHPSLVRELLRMQLRERAPDLVGRLHECAAHWYAAEGLGNEAIDHALEAGDWEQAVTLVVECLGIGRLLLGSPADTQVARFHEIPTDAAGPRAAVVKAAVALVHGDTERSCKELASARELAPPGSGRDAQVLELAISATEAVGSHVRGDIESTLAAAATAHAVLTDLGLSPGAPASGQLRVLLLATVGAALIRAGTLERAGEALTDGLQAAEDVGCDAGRMRCLGELALLAALRGELHRAAGYARTADIVADRCELPVEDRPPVVAVVLAWVAVEADESTTARRYADRAAGCSGISQEPVLAGLLALVRARLHRASGDLDGAMIGMEQASAYHRGSPLPEWLQDLFLAAGAAARLAGGTLDIDEARLRNAANRCPRCAMALAATMLTSGGSVRAIERCQEILWRADLPVDVRVEGWLLVCDGELMRDRREPARVALQRALVLAAPQTLRRPFVEASARVRELIRRERDVTEYFPLLNAVGSVAPASSRRVATCTVRLGGLVEPLTERESEVLLHLSMLLSTEEIARKMFISVNTVKTHIRGIFRKLCVARRNEAIRRARDLGLI